MTAHVMTGSMHNQAALQIAEDVMGTSDGAQWLSWVQRSIRCGAFEQDVPGYTAAIGSPFAGWGLGEVYSLGVTHGMVSRGEIGRVRIEVGETPSSDAIRKENRMALLHAAEPFVANLDMAQNGADCDGTLSWTEPIVVNVGNDEVTEVNQARGIPLEVGSCDASTVYLHLLMSGAVARWPYGCKHIWLFVGLPSPIEFLANRRTWMADIVRGAGS